MDFGTPSGGRNQPGRPADPRGDRPNVEQIDFAAVAARLPLAEMLGAIDVDALLARIDSDALVRRVDAEALIRRVDVEAMLHPIDLGLIVADVRTQVDVGGIVRKSTDPYPGLQGSAPPLPAQHDWVHVLADYGTTIESELEVFTFIARASADPRAFSLVAMVISLFETGYLSRAAGLRSKSIRARPRLPDA